MLLLPTQLIVDKSYRKLVRVSILDKPKEILAKDDASSHHPLGNLSTCSFKRRGFILRPGQIRIWLFEFGPKWIGSTRTLIFPITFSLGWLNRSDASPTTWRCVAKASEATSAGQSKSIDIIDGKIYPRKPRIEGANGSLNHPAVPLHPLVLQVPHNAQ